MNKRIISNQVFQEIQEPTYELGNSKGTIIYANTYSGIQSIDMPEPYKSILNSDFGETGNSVIVQLEQKIQGFPNGPWFIDSIDDIIYIHNRKYSNGPVHKYTYQGGNGELLDIEFQTQYITRRLDGTITSGISSDKILNTDFIHNKSFDKHYGDYLVSDTATFEEKMMALESAYADFQVGKISKSDLEALEEKYPNETRMLWGQHQLSVVTDARRRASDIELENQAIRNSTLEAYDVFKADEAQFGEMRANKLSHHRSVQDILDKKDLSNEVQRIIDEVAKGSGKSVDELIQNMKQAADDGKLEYFMKLKFGSSKHALDEALSNTNPNPYQVIYVDPRDYSGSPKAKLKSNSYGYQLYLAQSGYDNLQNDPSVIIIDNDSRPNSDTYYLGKKLKVFKRVETVGIVSQYQILYTYYTRKYGSGNTGSWKDVERRISESGNRNKQITERKLVCNMTCIGNPKLESSQIVLVSNVGKRWSGAWYIKSCTHQFTGGQGYTCRMELVKSDVNLPVKTSSMGVDTRVIRDKDNEDPASINNLGSEGIRTLFTEDEIIWTYDKLLNEGRGAAQEAVMTILSSKDKAHEGKFTDYGLGAVRQRVTTSTTGSNTKHEYSIDERLKPTQEELKKYSAPASRLVEELERSINEDIGGNKNVK